jgi:hypothetical protein
MNQERDKGLLYTLSLFYLIQYNHKPKSISKDGTNH